MQRKLSIINLLSVVLVIAVNYISQAVRINDTTIGELSRRYANLFTPASYAFAIWGLIFLGLLAYALFQIKVVFFDRKELVFIEQTGYWFALANVLNAMWVIAFAYDYMGLTVIIITGILISLLKIIINTNMERWDAPKQIIAFAWWPICFYSGWITFATIANIALYLTKIGWNGAFLTEVQWTIVLAHCRCHYNKSGHHIQKKHARIWSCWGMGAIRNLYAASRQFGNYCILRIGMLCCTFIGNIIPWIQQ